MAEPAKRFQFSLGDIFITLVMLAFPVAFASNLDPDIYSKSERNVLWVLVLGTGVVGFLAALLYRRSWQSRSPLFVPPFLCCVWSILLLFYAADVPRPALACMTFYPGIFLGIALTAYLWKTHVEKEYLSGLCVLILMQVFSFLLITPIEEQYLYKRECMAANTCKAITDAQEIYHRTDYDKNGWLEFATELHGLYETKPGAADIQLISAALVSADATTSSPHPYHGYYFRVLHEQGEKAPGGVKSWFRSGLFILAHGVIAYPSEYGKTGRLTFLISSRGDIYQQDYGPNTPKIAKDMVYNPDIPKLNDGE